jgi:hypothetical protein
MPKSDLPWAIAVSEGPVIACRTAETYLDGDKCPEEVFAQRIEFDLSVPFSITTGPTKLTDSPDSACPHYRGLEEQPSDITQLGRVGKDLSPEDPDVSAWLKPLLTDDLKVVRVRSLDIDGDGRDESFYELDTHPNMAFVQGPAKMLSVVGMRSVGADGVESITQLYRDAGELAAGSASEVGYGKGSLYGFADLEGDGALEAVIVGGKVQDMRYEVYSLAGGGAARLAQLACKWGETPQ